MVDLSVNIGSLKLRNPTILASGILGVTSSQLLRVYNAGAGGVVTKSFTKNPLKGYDTPIIVGFKCGYLNAVGLANPGIESLEEIIKPLIKRGIPTIVSLAGSDESEFKYLAKKAYDTGATAIELNLSCPHVKKKGLEIGSDPELVRSILRALRNEIDIPIFVKLGISDNMLKVSEIAEQEEADAIVLINTVRGMVIDVWTRKPILSNKIGGVSGCAIHPIAVRAVYEVYKTVNIPIIGVGGVEDWKSAVELILAGATAVQVGSAIAYKGLEIFKEISNGIENYLKQNGFRSVSEIIGLAHK